MQYSTGRIFPALSAIQLMLLLPFAGSATGRTDVRISHDAQNYELPADIRIQSAAQTGDYLLGVWGTRIETSDGALINALAGRVNDDQQMLTGEERGRTVRFTPSRWKTALRSSGTIAVVEGKASIFVSSAVTAPCSVRRRSSAGAVSWSERCIGFRQQTA